MQTSIKLLHLSSVGRCLRSRLHVMELSDISWVQDSSKEPLSWKLCTVSQVLNSPSKHVFFRGTLQGSNYCHGPFFPVCHRHYQRFGSHIPPAVAG